MASSATMLPQEQFQCTICQQVFNNPVTTPCGHNFCQACLQSTWDSSSVCQCPTCNKSFTSRPEISINTAFKELVSAEKEMAESDRLLAYLIGSIQERQTEVHTEIEEKQKAAERRAEELVDELQQEVTELQRRNTELEELRSTEDHLHLLQRLPSLTSPPPTRQWTEISVHPELCVGTLRRTLSKLDDSLKKELDTLKEDGKVDAQNATDLDVVLDPDTAHPNIVLSADGKQAGRGELLHIVPDYPQRFDPVICVLSKKGFLSGRVYFQVAVGQKTFWDLGVVKESVNRKGMITSKPENGFWTVRLRNGNEYRALDSPSVVISLKEKPQTVGVFMDYEEGTVSFFDVENRVHIYTFTSCLFSERVFPFLSPGVCDEGKNTSPLIITAANHKK
uniref:E3 ubiquitin-protein ligase TRIM39-like n=1 Tax=Stegastes partitus TaxID=144197 RepID=A0A3B5A9J8_9TELE